ncbi:MAG: NAD(P)H-hydrate epimerase, partial [Gemmatimonadetes bacterium]|nr:NAD(P)H-hydrate epimerase [Gemmatimonadota bacterium]
MKVVTPEEMALIDRAAVQLEGIEGLDLMERAGAGVAYAARDMLLAAGGRRVALCCGRGNNGGDGFVAARLLHRAGFEAEVFLVTGSREPAGDAKVNLERLAGLPVGMTEVSDEAGIEAFTSAPGGFDLVVDAIFGTGFSGEAGGLYAAAIEAVNASGLPVLAVDIPSGVSGATGAVAGPAVCACRTVTFAAPKAGILLYPGAGLAGEFEVIDIGIPAGLLESVPASRIEYVEQEDAAALLPVRAPDAHKGRCGNVLVVGGSTGMTGAPALCARAALRSGAGLVTAGVPASL